MQFVIEWVGYEAAIKSDLNFQINNQNFIYLHIKMRNKPEIKLKHGYRRKLEGGIDKV